MFDSRWAKIALKLISAPEYSVKIDNDFDQSCYGLIHYYGFSI